MPSLEQYAQESYMKICCIEMILQHINTTPQVPNEIANLRLSAMQASLLLDKSYWTTVALIREGKLCGGREGKSWYTTYNDILQFRASLTTEMGIIARNGQRQYDQK